MGALNNSARGVWAVTEAGRHLDGAVRQRHADYRSEIQEARRLRRRQERETRTIDDVQIEESFFGEI
jgi:hypothetical protein